MNKIKVMTIVGTRPELIKLSRVIAELDHFTDHTLVHTDQNYSDELNKVFFDDLNIRRPDYCLDIATGNVAQDIGNIISRIDPILEQETPDAILFYGDTNSTLAVIAAKRRQIPIFHMEAGNRCFDARVPEEINRKIIDHLSDVNMTISEHARRYLLNEGLNPNTTFKIGSCVKEVIQHYRPKINQSKILSKLKLKENDYFVVSLHREDNVDSQENLQLLLESLNQVATGYNKTIIFSTHPRTKNRLEALNVKTKLNTLIQFHTAFGFLDYIKLQENAFCVLSDSGSITEDSSILDFPAITLRRMHERPEGMDEGTLIMTGFKSDHIRQAIDIVTKQERHNGRRTTIVSDYNTDNVSKKVLRIIMSYIDYINQNVWHKK